MSVFGLAEICKKKGWRFSIAMLIFGMTVIAVMLGVIVWDVRRH